MITEKEVFIYREIYYEYFKPALFGRFAMSEKEAGEVLKPALEKFGWTIEKYLAFSHIDLMQRFSKMKSDRFIEEGREPRIHLKFGEEDADLLSASSVPELKCPIRTTQKW